MKANFVISVALVTLVSITNPAIAGNKKGEKLSGKGAYAHCPPGLAKKYPPCVPPGQAKKIYPGYHPSYDVGDRV